MWEGLQNPASEPQNIVNSRFSDSPGSPARPLWRPNVWEGLQNPASERFCCTGAVIPIGPQSCTASLEAQLNVLCCAVLCAAVLCCVVLSCAELCCAVLSCVVLSCAVL